MTGWHNRDVSADTGAGIAHPNSPLAGFSVAGGNHPRVYYLDNARRHVRELAWYRGAWHQRNLTADTGARPASAGSKLGGFSVADQPRVYHTVFGGHVQELAWYEGAWHHRDLTADTGAPPARQWSGLAGFSVAGGNHPRVYYQDNNAGHVQELAWYRGAWHQRDLTADTGALPAQSDSPLVGFPVADHPRVYYTVRNVNDVVHVHELAWYGNAWHHRDLTADTGARPASPYPDGLVGFSVAGGGGSQNPRVYYTDQVGHVRELAWYQGAWHHRDLTADTGAPPASSSYFSGLAGFSVAGTDPRVYYLDEARHVRELAWYQGAWHPRDVSADAGAPPAEPAGTNSALAGFSVAGGNHPRVYYLDTAEHVQELAWFQDEEPPDEEEPPGEQTRTVNLERQIIVEGFIPYHGRFPAFGVVPRGRLLRIRVPQVGFPDLALAFVKRNRSTAQCGDPSAVVVVREGQATTPTQLTDIFGVSEPRFSTTSPIDFVACLQQAGGPLPNFVPIEITIIFD